MPTFVKLKLFTDKRWTDTEQTDRWLDKTTTSAKEPYNKH